MPANSVTKKILSSSFWQYIGSWFDKLIGFISTIILARVLLPDDFGVIAATSIVTGIFHVIATVGTERFILRQHEITALLLDTGWSVNIIMRSLSSIGIFFLSAPIAEFMDDVRLTQVLQVISVSSLLAGFNNIGMILFEKDYNYKPRFIVGFTSRLIGSIIRISLAFYLHTYWAFIFAQIIEAFIYLIGTFAIHPYRPRFSFANWKQQWLFSQWILFKSLFVLIRFRIDNILLSKYFPLETLGNYTMAKDIATLPSTTLIDPLMDPLYVGLSAISDDLFLFADKVHKTISILFVIILPISLGIFITANNIVSVLLGAKWIQAIPLVEIMAFMLVPSTLGDFLSRTMMAMGNVKLLFQFEFILGLIMIGIFITLSNGLSINNFALLRLLIMFLNTSVVLIILTQLSKLSLFRIFGLIIVPALSSIAMLYSIIIINKYIISYQAATQLALQISIGFVVYFFLIALFIYLLRNKVNEYKFIWNTFLLSTAKLNPNKPKSR